MNENNNIIPGPGSEDAGTSEPVNDPGAQEQDLTQKLDEAAQVIASEQEQADQDAPTVGEIGDTPSEDPEAQVSIAVHLILTTDGQFAIQATGDPNLGEMQMIASRGLCSIEARITAETMIQSQIQAAQAANAAIDQKRIITPRRG